MNSIIMESVVRCYSSELLRHLPFAPTITVNDRYLKSRCVAMTAFLTLDIVCRLHVGSYFFGVMLKSEIKVINWLLTILTS